jgi:hypothetical protein
MYTAILALALTGLTLEPAAPIRIEDNGYLSSAGGNYRYRVTYTRDGPGETPVASFSLETASGEHRLTLDQPGQEMFFVSDAGWFVGAMATPGLRRLTFYTAQGRVVARRDVSAAANYAFTRAGQHLYVNARDGLLAFDSQGRQTADYGKGNWFLVSDDERTVALVQGNLVTVHCSGQTARRFRLTSPLFRSLAFSADGQLMATVERTRVSLYSLRTGERLWSDAQPDAISLLHVAVGADGSVWVTGEEPGREDGGLVMLYRNGTEAARVPIPYMARNEGLTGLTVNDTGVEVRLSDHSVLVREMP